MLKKVWGCTKFMWGNIFFSGGMSKMCGVAQTLRGVTYFFRGKCQKCVGLHEVGVGLHENIKSGNVKKLGGMSKLSGKPRSHVSGRRLADVLVHPLHIFFRIKTNQKHRKQEQIVFWCLVFVICKLLIHCNNFAM